MSDMAPIIIYCAVFVPVTVSSYVGTFQSVQDFQMHSWQRFNEHTFTLSMTVLGVLFMGPLSVATLNVKCS